MKIKVNWEGSKVVTEFQSIQEILRLHCFYCNEWHNVQQLMIVGAQIPYVIIKAKCPRLNGETVRCTVPYIHQNPLSDLSLSQN